MPASAAATGHIPVLTLAVQLTIVAAAAYAGGTSLKFLSIGHRPMQVLLSLTGGVLLGVGMLHLLPHAFLQLDRQIDATMTWVLTGFFLMFLLERSFHGHAHHAPDGDPCGHGPGGGDHPRDRPRTHDHHDHGPASSAVADRPLHGGRWAWCGVLAGLTLHSLADGAALAASVRADGDHGAVAWAGFATFFAVLTHKPFDAAIIGTLMLTAGMSARCRGVVNAAYALMVPIGAVAFLASLRLFGGQQEAVLGVALALAAGAFLCIAAADLLPEVQFHSHDRVLLTSSLALGLAIAWGIATLERSSHSHGLTREHDEAREPRAPVGPGG